jgi:flagellar protein FlaG
MSVQSISGTAPAFSPGGGEVKSAASAAKESQHTSAKAPVGASAETTKKTEKPSEKTLREAVDRVAKFVSLSNNELSFTVDSESGNNVVKVIDTASKEVIRQIPSEEVIAISQALDKLQGLFVRDKA